MILKIEIHAGSGGEESKDFQKLLWGMYSKFIMKKLKLDGKTVIATDSYANLIFTSPEDSNFLDKETGVHRLVRVSPYDPEKRRHTSFATVVISKNDKVVGSSESLVRSYILDPYRAVSFMGNVLTEQVYEVLDGDLSLIGIGRE